jgi:galactokinase
MDQFINIHGKEKKVLKLDCRSLEYEYVPFEREDMRIVVCDTLVRRELASSEYNVRRAQCESGVALLAKYLPSVKSLRDATLEMLEAHRQELDPVVFKRCGYVVKENFRLLEACRALERNDFKAFGELMNGSHEGLRDEYEVSSPELDALVEAALKVPGVLGARMMGAGFGGCTISLVEVGAIPEFEAEASREYERAASKIPKIHVIKIEGGTHLIDLP